MVRQSNLMAGLGDKQVISLLEKYACPVAYHEVRTRFLGNTATPLMSVSPLQIVKALWGGELPDFDGIDDVNELMGIIVNGLWNDLTRHQKRSEPFRLLRTTIEPTQAGISGYTRMCREELDGFVEGRFNGEEQLDLPEKAIAAIDALAELRAIMAGIERMPIDANHPAKPSDILVSIKHLQELTLIIEREIHSVVLECTRARRQAMQAMPSPTPRRA
jgi:hypothetical protein